MLVTLVNEKTQFFPPKFGENRRNLAKIAENSDHNIDSLGPTIENVSDILIPKMGKFGMQLNI
jgi:hypothetical protein